MKKIIIGVLLAGCIVMMGVLFSIKHRVLLIERSLKELSIQRQQLIRNVAILRSELSFLTHPSRVEKLIQTFLPHFANLQPKQIVKSP